MTFLRTVGRSRAIYQVGAEARYCPVFSGLQDPHITLYASSALTKNIDLIG